MRRGGFFWPVILILVGVVLLLDNLGLLGGVSLWPLIGSLVLIALGLWFLLGMLVRRREPAAETVTVPLDGAARARVRIRHGAGRLLLRGGAEAGQLVNGACDGGLDVRSQRDGDTLDVDLRMPDQFFSPWHWGPQGLAWSLSLSGAVPLALDLETGASEAQLDLSELQVAALRLNTGASSVNLTMPARAGETRAAIKAGAASVNVRIPEGVAARIRISAGVSSTSVDRDRFPRVEGAYQSPDYRTAANRVELSIEAGVGSISVH